MSDEKQTPDDEISKPNLDEPSRSPPRAADRVQIVRHPAYWTLILQAGIVTRQDDGSDQISAYKAMVPTWIDVPKNQKIPDNAVLPMDDEATQGLFDIMWQQGFRPTGTKVVLETVPGSINQLDDIVKQVTTIRQEIGVVADKVVGDGPLDGGDQVDNVDTLNDNE